MEKLKKLLEQCQCGIQLEINVHRNYYDTAAKQLAEWSSNECPPEIADDVRDKIIETDTIIELQFYPHTPIGFYHIVHYDLEAALDLALACFDLPTT